MQVSDEFWKSGLCIRVICHIIFTYLHIVCPVFVLLCVLMLRSLGWAEIGIPKTSLQVTATDGDTARQGFEEDLAGSEYNIMLGINESTEGNE